MTNNCKLICWIIAAVLGLILWALIGGFWGFVIGLALALAFGYFVTPMICKGDDAPSVTSSSAPSSAQSADAVAAPAAAPAPAGTTTSADRPANAGAATAAPAAAPTAETEPAAAPEPAPSPAKIADTETTGGTEPAAPVAAPPEKPVVADATAATAAEGDGTKPAGLSAARDGQPDDLKKIKGVGPKLEIMLNEMGYFHFDQIAAWTADEVAWVDQNLKGFKGRVSRDSWVDQATQLATGGETEFSKRVDKGDVY